MHNNTINGTSKRYTCIDWLVTKLNTHRFNYTGTIVSKVHGQLLKWVYVYSKQWVAVIVRQPLIAYMHLYYGWAKDQSAASVIPYSGLFSRRLYFANSQFNSCSRKVISRMEILNHACSHINCLSFRGLAVLSRNSRNMNASKITHYTVVYITYLKVTYFHR